MSEESLPEGWARLSLADAGVWSSGGTPSRKVSAYFGGGIPWVKSGDLNDTVVTSVEETLSQSGLQNSSAKVLPKGTVSIAMYGATIGKTGIFGLDAATNQACANCRVHEGLVDRKFLLYFLQSQKDEFVGAGQGGAQPNISATILKAWPFLLAPLPEQHRIVEKVEALLEQVNRAKARLDRVPLILKRFRQAVLAAACSGELTREWREERGHSDPWPRKAWLKDQRRQLWASLQQGPRTRKYSEPFDAVHLFDLPNTWEWVTVSNLAILDVGFAFKSTDFAKDGVRLLRGENVEPGALRWVDTKFLPKPKIDPARHHQVEDGEIILALDRPIVAAGLKIARVRDCDLPALLVQRVMRFKMVDKADTDYLFHCLRDKRFIDFIAHEGMTGSDLPHITGTGVAEFSVPLPPRDEQAELVRRIESMFALADTIERRVQAATARANKLPQAILSKAFSGELVPTEAELARLEGRTYETAEELLKRVTALGSDAPSARKGRGRRTG